MDLSVVKEKKKYLICKIEEYKKELNNICIILDTYNKCYLCKEPYNLENLRILTDKELDLIEQYDNEQYDNDSCYDCLQEDELYCYSCIKKRFKDLHSCV